MSPKKSSYKETFLKLTFQVLMIRFDRVTAKKQEQLPGDYFW